MDTHKLNFNSHPRKTRSVTVSPQIDTVYQKNLNTFAGY